MRVTRAMATARMTSMATLARVMATVTKRAKVERAMAKAMRTAMATAVRAIARAIKTEEQRRQDE